MAYKQTIKMNKLLITVIVLAAMALPNQGHTQSEPMLGEVKIFAGNFAPQGWALCDGALLSIASNTALFSIIGTNYGGDGRTTFALPNLQGRVVVHPGSIRGGNTQYHVGKSGGSETAHLTVYPMPKELSSSSSGTKNVTTNQTLDNMQPYLSMNYIICLTGLFPRRN